MRQAIFGELSSQLRASGYLLGFQLPWRPERELVRDDAALVADLMRRWGGPGFPDPQTEARTREAMQIPGVAHSSMEYYRWVFRSMFRPDGWRMLRDMHELVTAPTLQLHGPARQLRAAVDGQGIGRVRGRSLFLANDRGGRRTFRTRRRRMRSTPNS